MNPAGTIPIVYRSVQARTETIDVRAWHADLAAAETSRARFQISRRLDRLPLDQVRESIEETDLIEGRQLTLAAKLLLVRWAAEDGEAAMQWAWLRFRSEDVWDEAFREIIAAWSWSQPTKLAAWAKRLAALRDSPNSHISRTEAEQSDHPILDSDAMRRIAKNLAHVSPTDAIDFLMSPGGSAGWDSRLIAAFSSVPAVREALHAIEDSQSIRWDLVKNSGAQIDMWLNNEIEPETIALSLLQHWKNLDPDDFQKSHYANLLPAPTATPVIEPSMMHGGWVAEFFEWSSKNPGVHPAMNDWPEEKIEAWKDHDELMHGPRRNE